VAANGRVTAARTARLGYVLVLVAQVAPGLAAIWNIGRISAGVLAGNVFRFWCRHQASLMLGVEFNNRESVHDPMKVVLTPNIGLESRL
jgi:hypothetical protein